MRCGARCGEDVYRKTIIRPLRLRRAAFSVLTRCLKMHIKFGSRGYHRPALLSLCGSPNMDIINQATYVVAGDRKQQIYIVL